MLFSWRVFTTLRTHFRTIRPHVLRHKTFMMSSRWNDVNMTCSSRNHFVSRHIRKSHILPRHGHHQLRLYSSQSAEKISMKDEVVRAYAKHLHEKYEDAGRVLSSGEKLKPEVEEDAKNSRAKLATLSELYVQHEDVRQQCVELQNMLEESGKEDAEMSKMLDEDINDTRESMKSLDEQIMLHLVAPEFGDECDAIMELNAGAGGQEAMLFTEEIYGMYQGYAAHRGWDFHPVTIDESPIGGVKKATIEMSGRNIYKILKYEGGVHRVQRQPETEKSGRLHTSTMSVAVLPQPTEIDVVIHPKDIKMDTFRASGPGGQGVNKSESAVRITHLPSGIVVECQEGRSQLKNKETALKVLRSRLYEAEMAKRTSAQQANFKIQTGTRARSEKIRTYNYQQDRVTDHRISVSTRNLPEFMLGGEQLDQMIGKLMEASRLERLQEILNKFQKNMKS